MNAQQIFDLAREYGAEHPGITFDLAALLRYTRKVQEMEREAILQMSREQWFKTQAEFEAAIQKRGKT